MSVSPTVCEEIVFSEVYKLVSDIKAEIVNLDESDEITLADGVHCYERNFYKRNCYERKNTVMSETREKVGYRVASSSSYEPCPKRTRALNEYGTEYKSISDEEDDLDLDARLPASNFKPLKFGSINSEEKDFRRFYLDLLQCERDCGICQDYIRKLSEHVRATHIAVRQTLDPLIIDPLDLGQSNGIKCKIDEDIERMDCSEESDSSSESEIERGGDSDPDYIALSELTRKYKSGQKVVMDHKGDRSSRKDGMKSEAKVNDGEKPHKCKECGSGFRQKSSLTCHMMIHTGKRPFKCEECGKGLTKKFKLTIHMRSHTGDRPFKCGQCGKCFASNSHLTVHIRNHTRDKPLKCEQCDASFSECRELKIHMRNHTGERPYMCGRCPSRFTRRGNMTVHLKSHIGERPYRCEECGKRFPSRSKLGRHTKTHSEEKNHKCDVCDKCFKSSDSLHTHKKKHSPGNVKRISN